MRCFLVKGLPDNKCLGAQQIPLLEIHNMYYEESYSKGKVGFHGNSNIPRIHNFPQIFHLMLEETEAPGDCK